MSRFEQRRRGRGFNVDMTDAFKFLRSLSLENWQALWKESVLQSTEEKVMGLWVLIDPSILEVGVHVIFSRVNKESGDPTSFDLDQCVLTLSFHSPVDPSASNWIKYPTMRASRILQFAATRSFRQRYAYRPPGEQDRD